MTRSTAFEADYASKRLTADSAVSRIPSGSHIAMGMAVAEPPALLTALTARVEDGLVDALKLWYFHSLSHAAETMLRYELLDRVRPHCMFLSKVERALIRRGDAEGGQPIEFVPTAFSDSSRLLTEQVPSFTKLLRFTADTFFAKRYGHRAIVLETVAAVPGMVGAMFTHLTCLRRMKDDEGWIRTLMEEAENERMHLMTFIEIAKPTLFERLVILLAQWVFLVMFSLLYLFSSRTAHRVVGYFEEEAVISYTLYLKEIDEGRSANVPAPAVAKHYWKMPANATLRDVVLLVRADEAHHRDVNHGFASKLGGRPVDPALAAPYPPHANDIRLNA